jgi:putative transcriptional regulator
MKKYSAQQMRPKARINRKKIDSTSEADVARHAAEDGSATDAVDFETALEDGQLRILTPVDVAEIRRKTGLSQDRFAKAFQISPHTLRNWEQGRRVPEGPARALLLAIERDPEAVMRALAA